MVYNKENYKLEIEVSSLFHLTNFASLFLSISAHFAQPEDKDLKQLFKKLRDISYYCKMTLFLFMRFGSMT